MGGRSVGPHTVKTISLAGLAISLSCLEGFSCSFILQEISVDNHSKSSQVKPRAFSPTSPGDSRGTLNFLSCRSGG